MKNNFTPFYKVLDELTLRSSSVSKRRVEVHSKVSAFKKDMESYLAQNIHAKNKEMSAFIKSKLDSMRGKIQSWEEKFEELAEQEALQERLTNSFIVIIYGNVNAGKSTLGNFIAQNCLPHQKPQFRRFDNGKEEYIQKFETNITECTASIQFFILGGSANAASGGIAWVDTPGLSSMTKKNGELAEKHIGAADYIIFPTSSQSPMQNDEIEQLKKLTQLGKSENIRIIITKSDTTEEDEDSNGNIIEIPINKSKENREGQERDVAKRLREAIPNHTIHSDIISLSVISAKMGLEQNNRELFEGSNMVEFYNSMYDVLTNKAQQLKSKSPYTTLIGLIDSILNSHDKKAQSLESIEQDFKNIQDLIQSKRREFKDLASGLESDISLEINAIYSRYEKEINENNAKKIFTKIQDEIKVRVEKLLETNLTTMLQDFNNRFEAIMPAIDTEVKDIYSEIPKEKERNILKRLINLISFDTLFCQEYEIEKVKTGNNLESLKAENRKIIEQFYKGDFLTNNLKEVEDMLLTPCDTFAKELKHNIATLRNSLSSIKQSIANQR